MHHCHMARLPVESMQLHACISQTRGAEPSHLRHTDRPTTYVSMMDRKKLPSQKGLIEEKGADDHIHKREKVLLANRIGLFSWHVPSLLETKRTPTAVGRRLRPNSRRRMGRRCIPSSAKPRSPRHMYWHNFFKFCFQTFF